jgi:hypothetical protein
MSIYWAEPMSIYWAGGPVHPIDAARAVFGDYGKACRAFRLLEGAICDSLHSTIMEAISNTGRVDRPLDLFSSPGPVCVKCPDSGRQGRGNWLRSHHKGGAAMIMELSVGFPCHGFAAAGRKIFHDAAELVAARVAKCSTMCSALF